MVEVKRAQVDPQCPLPTGKGVSAVLGKRCGKALTDEWFPGGRGDIVPTRGGHCS
jgi:hypothetical protein